ncbi:MAG TPA: UDP-N-acetylmuramate--L-alanine ligase [Thermoanaerobaculia bacterium]|nr:UDP-N-acetylmuramate--L-alanine ligase [Thermoanaerobaculia bacterium]
MNFENIKNIHFVGIGGIGMSGIAEILAAQGVHVSGCDLKPSAATELLARRGISVTIGHHPSHLAGADLVVVTSAVRGAHQEIDAARRQGIPVVKRKEMLGAIAARQRTIGVAGTHGKTTTSAMIAVILDEAGLDPTVIIGGILRNIGSNAKRGTGQFAVNEADEYDRSFHALHPEIAVVTNVEADHLEYYGTFEAIAEAFRLFVGGMQRGGMLAACADDPAVAGLLASIEIAPPNGIRIVRYGLTAPADLTAANVVFHECGSEFDVPGAGHFRLLVPGEHNVRNALAAIAVARELGVRPEVIAAGLAMFTGVDRRFEILGEYAGALIVDDYAHHPTEIRATLNAARRGYPRRRIVALFQPHLYSRTRDFARDFAQSLRVADVAIVAPIYPAREAPIEGVTARLISESAQGVEFLERSNDEIVEEMRHRLRPNDLFITLGAGDVRDIAEALAGEGV